ncbi:MAG: MurR/RpiR family transcriptional regulator [Ottowia sp.]|nr:MurR/RpiR family transcriptional regulator [Ottowia sp.]
MNTAPSSLEDLIERLRSDHARLSPQLQRGARYVIDHPTEVSTLSMRKVAACAGVRPATLSRLAQSLGYAGWPQLKALFSQELRVMPESYAQRARALLAGRRASPDRSLLDTRVQADNLLSLEIDNAEALPQAVALLQGAGRVIVAGFRSSYPIAFGFRYLYSLFRPNVHLLDSSVGALDHELRYLQPSDVIVIITYAPYTREVLDVTRAATRQGSPFIAVCDSRLAPVARGARCVLMFRTQSTSFFPSTVAAQALVELLAQQLLVRAGAGAVDDLERVEAQLHASGAYL